MVLTNRSCIPERDCLISRASGQHVGVGQKLDTVDRVSMTAEAQHTHTTEIMQVGIQICNLFYQGYAQCTYLLVSHIFAVLSMAPESRATPSQCQLQLHTASLMH